MGSEAYHYFFRTECNALMVKSGLMLFSWGFNRLLMASFYSSASGKNLRVKLTPSNLYLYSKREV